MGYFVGIDLHGDNNYIGILDEEDRKVFKRRNRNDINEIKRVLEPYKKEIKGIVVESTFNWYWIVDGLMEAGYQVHLANTSAMQQYEGLKYIDDTRDSFWLAKMLRLKILPEGYIYPKETRSVRDLLRKRMMLVQQRTVHILSMQTMVNRNKGVPISGDTIKKLSNEEVMGMFSDVHLTMSAQCDHEVIEVLNKQIYKIEKAVLKEVKLKKPYKKLLKVPGIGEILAMTIMLETGNIERFSDVGMYSSYCRCVSAKKLSNGKSKGKGNRKNGNKYLAWAYVEAAHFHVRFCEKGRKWHQRKASKSHVVLATKALSNKLARACYYIIKEQVNYDEKKMFG
ncbi:transposase [Candidatus Kuenenia stuttgartiensis]|uniref:Transposase n=1 Tax=Kuenenia stuttgartiensis TaxID=174633 RepID=Q1PVN4_KUEST|nr:IS110 family transposase [Candidatus Kuenenia stuttgartiensis]QII14227.1 transposase [Candidatus Kuenenia stuttgartiensis]CAJ71295.1 hypothetical protein kustc0550 [Candidatus Kuenenia stuttgartiensis]